MTFVTVDATPHGIGGTGEVSPGKEDVPELIAAIPEAVIATTAETTGHHEIIATTVLISPTGETIIIIETIAPRTRTIAGPTRFAMMPITTDGTANALNAELLI